MLNNYNSALDRLNRCKSLDDIETALKGFERVHKVGHLTDKELINLDLKALDIVLEMEEV